MHCLLVLWFVLRYLKNAEYKTSSRTVTSKSALQIRIAFPNNGGKILDEMVCAVDTSDMK
jgi:hypothetical protein